MVKGGAKKLPPLLYTGNLKPHEEGRDTMLGRECKKGG